MYNLYEHMSSDKTKRMLSRKEDLDSDRIKKKYYKNYTKIGLKN